MGAEDAADAKVVDGEEGSEVVVASEEVTGGCEPSGVSWIWPSLSSESGAIVMSTFGMPAIAEHGVVCPFSAPIDIR